MTPGAAEAAERTRLRAPLRALRRLSRVPPQETARSKTVSPDYLRILSWEEYNRSDEDARMFHFFISVGFSRGYENQFQNGKALSTDVTADTQLTVCLLCYQRIIRISTVFSFRTENNKENH
ncbi:hypothetical protein E5288_WYG019648 [Bos mutus]|uniref:Uncharacterized protein n=1 Tax=Bos mutus TaxID=72004 RepID=A0A6B0RV08_9CETA|nr:hypothetical protein [Bos mutus]